MPHTSRWIFTCLAMALVAMALAALACITPTPDLPLPAPTTPVSETSDWYTVYLTDPGAEFLERGLDETLAAAIDQARLSVDVAVYDLDLATIRNALIHAHQRGVKVRLVTETDNLEEEAIQAIKKAGIPVVDDRGEGYMHNKFTVIDRLDVWGGSMNYTSNDTYRNNNNLIRIRSTKLAENYTTEFEEMFVAHRFSANIRADTPYPSLTVNETSMEVYFSPDDGAAGAIVDQIQQAQHNICFLAFSFTSDEIGEALIERYKMGVSVAGVFETSQYKSNTGSEFDPLRTAGLDVWLDANPRNQHNKVIVIDGQTVITGSYNFTARAETVNDENAMIIHNVDIAGLYQAECEKLLALAKAKK